MRSAGLFLIFRLDAQIISNLSYLFTYFFSLLLFSSMNSMVYSSLILSFVVTLCIHHSIHIIATRFFFLLMGVSPWYFTLQDYSPGCMHTSHTFVSHSTINFASCNHLKFVWLFGSLSFIELMVADFGHSS